MPRIIVESGQLRGREFVLPARGSIAVGRDARCPIRITDGMVSRVHLTIAIQGDSSWTITDSGSSNGTWVNGCSVDHKVLTSGDMIKAGETLLTFLEDQADPLVGQTLAGYRIESRLGRGAMGTVYRAWQLSLDRAVALKILAPHLEREGNFVRQFLEEARAAGKLNHPNVVQVYDAGVEAGHHYISMEFLEGGTVEELLVGQGKIPPSDAIRLAIDAARALSFAEEQGIVHRDIKPANLLLDANGTLKVGDLGIAADLSAVQGDNGGKIVGSPRYMSPEQARGESIDHRADIYALGASLYRMLSGKMPFDGTSVPEILRKKVSEKPPPLRTVASDVSPQIITAVQRMMAFEPNKRFASAGELERSLERIAHRGAGPRGAGAHRPARRRVKRAAAAKGGSSQGLAIWALAVVGVILVFGVVSSLMRGGTPDPSKDSTQADGSGRGPNEGGASKDGYSGEGRGVPGDAKSGVADSGKPEPEDDPSLVLEKLLGQLESGLLAADEVETRIKAIESDLPTQSVNEAYEIVRRHRENRLSKVSKLAARRLSTLSEEGKFREADAVLSEFHDKYGDPRDWFEGQIDAHNRRMSVEIMRATDAVSEKLTQNDVTRAFQIVEALKLQLPDDRRDVIDDLRGRIEDYEFSVAKDETEDVSTLKADIATSIRSLDWPRLEALLAEEQGAGEEAKRWISLGKDCLEVWASLKKAVATKAARGVPVRLPSRMTGGERKAGFVLMELPAGIASEGESYGLLCLKRRGGPDEYRPLLSIGVKVLEDLAMLESMLEPSRVHTAVAWIVAFRRGVDATDGALTSSDAEEAGLNGPAVTERISGLRAIERAAEGSEHAASLAPFLFHESRDLLESAAHEDPTELSELSGVFLRSRIAGLVSNRVGELFHASRVSFEDGLLELSYDFREASQLMDFSAGTASSNTWEAKTSSSDSGDEESSEAEGRSDDKADGVMKLRGVASFLEGLAFEAPFQLSLRASGLDTDAPNVNVAMFAEGSDDLGQGLDEETLRKELRRSKRRRRIRADYLVFGNGFRLPSTLARASSKDSPDRDELAELTRLLHGPSFALLGGEKGESLSDELRSRLLWSSESSIAASIDLQLHVDERSIRWTVNDRMLPVDDSYLASAPRGGVRLFTYASAVTVERFEFRGRVDAAALAAKARSYALEELLALGGLPPK